MSILPSFVACIILSLFLDSRFLLCSFLLQDSGTAGAGAARLLGVTRRTSLTPPSVTTCDASPLLLTLPHLAIFIRHEAAINRGARLSWPSIFDLIGHWAFSVRYHLRSRVLLSDVTFLIRSGFLGQGFEDS